MQAGETTVLEDFGPHSDEAFQKLLLSFSAAAARGTVPADLIAVFCKTAREFFRVPGVYFWRCVGKDELLGVEADGLMSEQFRGTHLRAGQSDAAMEAVRSRRTVCINNLDALRYPMAAQYRARSLMAAPLVVANEVVGATVYLHDADPEYFTDDFVAKATILAGQLGSLVEASRLSVASQEESRQAEILAEVAEALHSGPDHSSVIEAVADRLRVLLHTQLVCILLKETGRFTLRAIAAESPHLAESVRARHDRKGLEFVADIANRAVAHGDPLTVAIDPANHALGDLIPAGMLIAAPFRTSQTHGVVLVYPRAEGAFNAEERRLVAAVAGFGAVAIANAELCSTAQAQANELHQLLEISSALSTIGDLDQFLAQISLHACEFLGFRRAFIGLLEDGLFHVRWGSENGRAVSVDLPFPEGVASRTLLQGEVFWTDNPTQVPGANLEIIRKFDVRQLLAVPLFGTERQVVGMFAVLDRADQAVISQEDIRRAQALAAHACVALEVKRNLSLSEKHRQRAELLMELALELNACLHLAEIAKTFVSRAAAMVGAHAAALAVKSDVSLETILLQGQGHAHDQSLKSRLASVLSEIVSGQNSDIIHAEASELIGSSLAANLQWRDCTLVRLQGTSGELVGVWCLANRDKPLKEDDRQLLRAVAGHASIALENARLFTRMDRANRHWMEIFDAITDFIVVHDETGAVLRVNRSLAEFIGAQPREIIGVNIGALLASGDRMPLRSCPFCRPESGPGEEYVHPVLDRRYLVSTSRVSETNSEGPQTIHVLKDITDREEAERRYRELFDNIQEGLFFSTVQGRFIEVNDAMVRMLGYETREELLNVDIPSQLYFSRESREHALHAMEQSGGVLRNFELSLRRKDGAPVHLLVNALAIRDGQGRILQYRGLMLDISGLKSYQTELQRERDFSGKILNNTQNLIVVADSAALISYANRRWQEMGYELDELIGLRMEELASTLSRPPLVEAINATLAGSQVDNLEVQIVRRDGRVGQFSVNLSPMRDEQGNVISIVAVMSDITDAASLQSKLMHAEKLAAVGQLVSGVAHEVNNPLTAILGFADLLLENPEVPEIARKDVRVILQEAQRTKQIVQNLLSFARQMPPQRNPVQLNSILRRTVQLRAYDFHSHGIEVIEQFDESLPPVVGDAHQLQQVFLNILNNAYDAVREGGRPARIEIMTARSGSFVETSFQDNGQGISHPDRIFDPFFTTKEVGKGTGLGLSICYGIVHEHGGEILCHNNVAGEGATFIVRLPVAPEPVPVPNISEVSQR
jgi:PAS domain S-box-containing protein